MAHLMACPRVEAAKAERAAEKAVAVESLEQVHIRRRVATTRPATTTMTKTLTLAQRATATATATTTTTMTSPSTALARLQQLRDPEYKRLAMQHHDSATSYVNKNWDYLKSTKNIKDWLPVLVQLGADHGVVQGICMLAQQGPAGRMQANMLLWQRSRAPSGPLNYMSRPRKCKGTFARRTWK